MTLKELIISIMDYDITGKELSTRLDRIKNNFYSNYGMAISEEAIRLYDKTFELECTYSFLIIAHDIESAWRLKNSHRYMIKSLCNPHAVEFYPYSQVEMLTVKSEWEVRGELSHLSYKEFLQTPYWRAIAYYKKSQDKVCARCGSDKELQLHHTTYSFPRGLEHINLDKLKVLCHQCHLYEHLKE